MCVQDCTLRVWRISDGAPQAFFMADAALSTACFAGAQGLSIQHLTSRMDMLEEANTQSS